MSVTQFFRPAGFHCPLGESTLVMTAMSGEEEISRPFRYLVELVSEDPELNLDGLIGQPGSIRLAQGDGVGGNRYFHGIISRFRQLPVGDRYARYQAELVPWLWLLTRTSDCRIFQKKTVPDIIEDTFRKHGFTDYDLRLTQTYQPREYCVQYRETDFNFVSRLMEQEGICYFFRHDDGKHYLVLADTPAAHGAVPGYEKIAWLPPSAGSTVTQKVRDWLVEKQLQPGTFAQRDYDFQKPRADLSTQYHLPRPHTFNDYEIYDYPGEYGQVDEGENYARIRIEEFQSRYEITSGRSDARGLAAGHTFTLTDYPRHDQNRTNLVLSVRHQINVAAYASGELSVSGRPLYECDFTVMEAVQAFRPARSTPKPIVQGPQTAVVVGPKGEEIYTDKYGRVKVHFHWDRHDQQDQNSSCWIRVAHSWAGKKWGALHIPRLGQEVVVEFLEGDPDQPLITGSVYNEEQRVPYDLPAEMTKSTLKSSSTKGGVGFNEIRLEDKKDQEQIFLHAERNMDVRVKHDSMERIIHDRHLIAGAEKDGQKSGDQREMVYRDKHLKVHRHQVEHIGGDMQFLIGGVDAGKGNQDIVLKGTKKELIEKDSHARVKGKRHEKVDGDQSLTVGGNQQEKVGQKHALDAGQEIHLKAGMKVIIEAGMQLTLKGPGGFVDIGPAGVTIQGTMVLINSGGAAGSGGGSSPTAPEDAKEAKPTEPAQADDAPSGQKSSRS